MIRIVLIAIAALALAAPLSACGKKGQLDRPGLTASATSYGEAH